VCLWAVAATLTVPAAAQRPPRLVNATNASTSMLADWFGPLPKPVPPAPPLPWLAPVRDQRLERALIRGLVREYWAHDARTSPGPFTSSLIAYLSMRAIHQQLEGSNFATPRFFGGHVPFPLRSVLLSPMVADSRPRVMRFDDPDEEIADPAVARGARALQTIERYVGWPTMLQTLAAVRTGDGTQQRFAAALSEIRGTDMRFLVDECFHFDTVFDYAVASLQSATPASGHVETTVLITRQGPGMFTTNAGGDRSPIMTMRVRFADGTELRDAFDGAAPSVSRVYTAKTAAVSATVDPDVVLLLDVNRENNTIIRNAPTSRLGIRLALNWMTWLQQAMLTYTAIL